MISYILMKIIFVIISGADEVICADRAVLYKSMYSSSRLYFEKMKKIYDLEYFYVEYKEKIENEVEIKNDIMYIKGKEIFTKIYDKTIKALNYINKNYTYDYLVRTNISSFWNIHNLYKMALGFPLHNCLTGVVVSNTFISGTGIIMSKDVCETLAVQPLNQTIQCDDVYISAVLKSKYRFHVMNETAMYFLISGEKDNVIPKNKENILYFRIKNSGTEDLRLFKLLLAEIYDLH